MELSAVPSFWKLKRQGKKSTRGDATNKKGE
jgi:hypothetical protein